jgi:murein DD-endopeptidase MepM/ murein hydrolase activator NlpD
MKLGRFLAFTAAALLCGPPLAAQEGDVAQMETGRRYARWFLDGSTDSLWARFDARMRQALPTAAQFAAFRNQFAGQAGAETQVVSESVRREGGATVYERVSRFASTPNPFRITIATDAEGKVAGFLVRPEPQVAPDYATRTVLRLPFEGEWFVFWGGRTREQNYHVVHLDQRYAYDLVVRRNGTTHVGDGTRVEQYFCWGRPILAPGPGTVVVAVDSLPDNAPGQMDPANAPGNHVVIDHGNGEFSFLAHLRRGSVAVAPGTRVAAGHRLGECGNSGNTSEPHLHYHLQNTGVFGRGEGLPAPFTGYTADGQPVARGEPVRGQTIRP